jgi:hypothetical protein
MCHGGRAPEGERDFEEDVLFATQEREGPCFREVGGRSVENFGAAVDIRWTAGGQLFS